MNVARSDGIRAKTRSRSSPDALTLWVNGRSSWIEWGAEFYQSRGMTNLLERAICFKPGQTYCWGLDPFLSFSCLTLPMPVPSPDKSGGGTAAKMTAI